MKHILKYLVPTLIIVTLILPCACAKPAPTQIIESVTLGKQPSGGQPGWEAPIIPTTTFIAGQDMMGMEITLKSEVQNEATLSSVKLVSLETGEEWPLNLPEGWILMPGTSSVGYWGMKADAGQYEVRFYLDDTVIFAAPLQIKASEKVGPAPTQTYELKYDDGTADGWWAIGGPPGKGHLVQFSPPAIPFIINQVRIYGILGSGADKHRNFKVEIWAEDLKVLYTCQEFYDRFNVEPEWVVIDTPNIVVDGNFYVFVCTDSPKEGGIAVGYDSSVINKHSEVTEYEKITDWYLQTTKEKVNWMIRVVTGKIVIPTPVLGPTETSVMATHIHNQAWCNMVHKAQADEYYKYAIYASRILTVKHPEVYLQGDDIFVKAITMSPGFKKAYEIKDVHSGYMYTEEAKLDSAPFSFEVVEFSKYALISAREIYPDSYPFLAFLDRRLAPISTTLKTFDHKVTQFEKAEQLYFKEKLAGCANLYLVYCDNENAYLYKDGLLLSMQDDTVENVDGNPILIFNEEWVWYPLMGRDDTKREEVLRQLVTTYSTEIDKPVLSKFEASVIDELKNVTEIETTEQGLATLKIASIHLSGMARNLLTKHLNQQFPPFIPSRTFNEFSNLISPVSAYLAAVAEQVGGEEGIKAVCHEYLRYASTPDQQYWAHGHPWFYWMDDGGLEFSYRTHGGGCYVQANNIGAALWLAHIDHYRMAGFTFWEEGWGGHDFIYIPGQDLIISNGKVEDLQDTVVDYADDTHRESPFKYLHFIEHGGRWAGIGAHYHSGTLSPNEVLEILTYLRSIHGDDIQGGKIVDNELIPIPFNELSKNLEAEQTKWKPYQLPSMLSQKAVRGMTLDYTMEVDEAGLKEHRASVEILMDNLSAPSLKLIMEMHSGGAFLIPISNFKAWDNRGNELSVDYLTKQNRQFWTINTKDTDRITINYDITLNFLRKDLNTYLGYLDEDFGVSLAGWTFVVPTREYDVDNITVWFELPLNWDAYTPWEREGVHYTCDSLHDFTSANYALGDFTVLTKQIGNTSVSIATYANWEEEIQKEVTDYSFKAFEYTSNLFGATPLERYLSIYVPLVEGGNPAGLTETSGSQALPLGGDFYRRHEFEHRIFHTYNAFFPTGMRYKSSEEQWLVEGTNTYYDAKVQIELGYLKNLSPLEQLYKKYLSYVGSQYDVPITKGSKFIDRRNFRPNEGYGFMLYKKGALVSFLLDLEIKKVTNDEKSLDDLMKYQYTHYGAMNGVISNEQALQDLHSITGHEFDDFFQKYIYGNDKLPLDSEFSDDDKDGLANGLEKLIGTNPLSPN